MIEGCRRLFSEGIAPILVATAMFCCAVPAEADDRGMAKARFKEGMAAIKAENYPAALSAFEKSYRLVPKPALLFNIAMCEKAMFRYVDSIETFRRFIAESGDKIRPELETQAEQAIQQMMTLIGILKLSDAPDGAEVFVDGKSAGKTPFKEGIFLDPGQHAVRVEAGGFKPMSTEVTVASGAEIPLRAKLTKVTAWIRVECAGEGAAVELDGKAVGACPFEGEVKPGVHQVAVAGADMDRFERKVDVKPGDTVTVSVGSDSSEEEGPGGEGPRGLLIGGVVTTVLGVGAGVMGLAFNVKGMKDEEAANDATTENQLNTANDDIKTDGALRTVGYVAGGVLIATGIVLIAVHAKKKNKTEKPVALVPTLGGIGVTF